MVGQKYGTRKKVFLFFCPHMFLPKQDRSRLPSHYRAMTTARTTFLSSASPTSCDLRTLRITAVAASDARFEKTADPRLRCMRLLPLRPNQTESKSFGICDLTNSVSGFPYKVRINLRVDSGAFNTGNPQHPKASANSSPNRMSPPPSLYSTPSKPLFGSSKPFESQLDADPPIKRTGDGAGDTGSPFFFRCSLSDSHPSQYSSHCCNALSID